VILSLDTNVMIDLVNGRRPQVRTRYDEAKQAGHTLLTSSLAVHELVYGAVISRRPQVQLRSAEELLSELDVVDWSESDATAAAQLRAEFRRRGNGIGYIDMLIAGQAIARKWTLVSANLRDFNRVNGLAVLDWTFEPGEQP
jgi:tRNA(fMet)-specific endonuclease VapC